MARNAANPKGKDLKTNNQIAYSEEVEQLNVDRARSLDELAVSDELFSGVLEAVRTDIRKGLKTEDLLAKYAQLAAARVVTIAATDQDSGRALTAAKDILDRVHGKAKETKDVTHRLDRVKEEQLDALLLSELDVLEIEGKEVEDE
jgi:hypothetical protein